MNIEETLKGTRYENENYNLSMPFILSGKVFEIENENNYQPNFFSEVLISQNQERWIRIRTVRYPDMDALNIHKDIVKVFILYCDGYMMHGQESLYDANNIESLFGIKSGERYIDSIKTEELIDISHLGFSKPIISTK